MDVRSVAAERYDRNRAAMKAGDQSIFPGSQLDQARAFADAVAVKYPKPYGRFVPTLPAYWILHDGSWWYVVHDLLTLQQLVRTYVTHEPMGTPSDSVKAVWGEVWHSQPDWFKQQYPNQWEYHFHVDEGTPVRMPDSAAEQIGLVKVQPVVISPSINVDALDLQPQESPSAGSTSGSGNAALVIVGGLAAAAGLAYFVWRNAAVQDNPTMPEASKGNDRKWPTRDERAKLPHWARLAVVRHENEAVLAAIRAGALNTRDIAQRTGLSLFDVSLVMRRLEQALDEEWAQLSRRR